MPEIDEIKEFATVSKQIFKDFVKIGSMKLENIAQAISDDDSSKNRGYNRNEEFEDEDDSEYVDKYYELKEEVNSKEKTPSIIKKDVKNERVYLDLEFREENIMQAVVYAEIFGKPKAKRRRRW